MSTRSLVILFVSLVWSSPDAAPGQAPSYSIKITNTYFGRVAEVRTLAKGRIEIVTHLPKRKVDLDRRLTPEEKQRVEQFIAAFPLKTLKERYASNVRGEGSTTYEIRVGKQKKSIYQYFQEQKDLTALWKLTESIARCKGTGTRWQKKCPAK